MPDRLPMYVLTGFLGSGKTTLLQNLISTPEFSETAVIINEFGTIGLDHEMIESVEETTVVLDGGCVCCVVREDLASSIRKLVELRRLNRLTPFRRLVIETTGLADPVPVIMTLMADPRVVEGFELQGIVATVDALNGAETLNQFDESRKQLLYADTAVITKSDLAGVDVLERLESQVTSLNPAIRVLTSDNEGKHPSVLFNGPTDRFDGFAAAEEWKSWSMGASATRHHQSYLSLAWEFEKRVDWTAFGLWLTMLLHAHGDQILRVKGILDVDGADGPVAIHGVQHMVYPPVHLRKTNGSSSSSRLVVITKGIDPEVVRRSFAAFAPVGSMVLSQHVPAETPMGAGRMIAGRPVRKPGAPAWIKG